MYGVQFTSAIITSHGHKKYHQFEGGMTGILEHRNSREQREWMKDELTCTQGTGGGQFRLPCDGQPNPDQ